MLLLRGISDLASNSTEVFSLSTTPWLQGATKAPEPTMFSNIPQSPLRTDTSQCVLPAVSSLDTAVSPRFNGGRLPSSLNSAIGTSSIHTLASCWVAKPSGFSFTPISCLAYCLVTFTRNPAISSLAVHFCQGLIQCSVHCALRRETTAISFVRQHDIDNSSSVNRRSTYRHTSFLTPWSWFGEDQRGLPSQMKHGTPLLSNLHCSICFIKLIIFAP